MESKQVTSSTVLLLWLIFAILIGAVSAQNVELLSEGDSFTYGRYHVWVSNDPKANSDHSEDFFTRNNSIVTVGIDNVTTTTVGVQITIQYQNGTQRKESMIHDLVTGYNTANTVFGDPRVSALDLIQRPQQQVNCTENRTYGGITREVNVFFTEEYGWTMHYNTVHNVTISSKRCYDAQIGMFLESESEMFIFNRNDPNLNQTIREFFALKDTNVWAAPKPPSEPEPPSIPYLPFIVSATAIAVTVAVMVYLEKRKR